MVDENGLIPRHTHLHLMQKHGGRPPCPGSGKPALRYVTRTGAPYRQPRALHPEVWACLLRLYHAEGPDHETWSLHPLEKLTARRRETWLRISQGAIELTSTGRAWVEARLDEYHSYYPHLDPDPHRAADALLDECLTVAYGGGYQGGARTNAWQLWLGLVSASRTDTAKGYLRERVIARGIAPAEVAAEAVEELLRPVLHGN